MIKRHISHESTAEKEGQRQHDFVPTRLIQVGDEDSNMCYLVDTTSRAFRHQWVQEPSKSRYAALSYCWGPAEDAKTQFKTERTTLEDRVKGFRIDVTSPVVNDAIVVVRSLNIPYLWVDALCIIQQDRPDWERESKLMGLVYQNAHLTICTPASSTCRQGFLQRHHRAINVQFQSSVDKDISGFYSIRSIGSDQFDGGEYMGFDFDVCSWGRRAWTYQEKALSKRVLVFGKANLHYHGNSAMQIEGGDDNGYWYLSTNLANLLSQPSKDGDKDLWLTEIVGDYTGRLLSHETDRLPAISGIARFAVRDCPEDYVAGIRRKYLHRDLFWSTNLGNWSTCWEEKEAVIQRLLYPEPYIAPTWSWVSRSSPVAHLQGDFRVYGSSFFDFRQAYEEAGLSAERSLMNPYGEVKSASLLLKATIMPAPTNAHLLVDRSYRKKRWQVNEAEEYVAYITLDWDASKDTKPLDGLFLALIGDCLQKSANSPLFDVVDYERSSEDRHHSQQGHDVTHQHDVDRPKTECCDNRYAYGKVNRVLYCWHPSL